MEWWSSEWWSVVANWAEFSGVIGVGLMFMWRASRWVTRVTDRQDSSNALMAEFKAENKEDHEKIERVQEAMKGDVKALETQVARLEGRCGARPNGPDQHPGG